MRAPRRGISTAKRRTERGVAANAGYWAGPAELDLAHRQRALDLYLDGIAADGRLSAKPCFDYRHYADKYVRPLLGNRKVRDVTPEVVLAWQRKLLKAGGVKHGQALAPTPCGWPARRCPAQ